MQPIKNDWALSNEYVVGRDLLVAPIMHKQDEKGGHRSIYLPQQHHWYRLNLRIDGSLGVPLGPKITGGTKFDVDATISGDESYFPYIAPMFVRGGKTKLASKLHDIVN
jgi:alpha-glucosidase (family GH31 glycosyl hydrolase)